MNSMNERRIGDMEGQCLKCSGPTRYGICKRGCKNPHLFAETKSDLWFSFQEYRVKKDYVVATGLSTLQGIHHIEVHLITGNTMSLAVDVPIGEQPEAYLDKAKNELEKIRKIIES